MQAQAGGTDLDEVQIGRPCRLQTLHRLRGECHLDAGGQDNHDPMHPLVVACGDGHRTSVQALLATDIRTLEIVRIDHGFGSILDKVPQSRVPDGR